MDRVAHIRFLSLYRQLLRLHKRLPKDFQSLGTSYVREEFKRHQGAESAHLQVFMAEWQQYAKVLRTQLDSSTSQLGKPLAASQLDDFSAEQVGQLYALSQETTKPEKPSTG